jgi:DNA-directed RNA polymerase subunit RPC12/RpoP
MLQRKYTCPKCSKTVTFKDLHAGARRSCPGCGHEIKDWDGKPQHQQHSGAPALVPPKIVALVVAALVIGTVLYFWFTR